MPEWPVGVRASRGPGTGSRAIARNRNNRPAGSLALRLHRIDRTMTTKVFRLTLVLAASLTFTLAQVGPAAAAPSDDRLLAMERYTSDKGRTLARTYEPALRELNTQIYHCMPWVEVQKESIGFFRPKPATQDDRYLSIRIFVEQEPSPQFASLAVEERASSMFSRYVGPLIRRMAAYVPPTGNPAPDGFTVIVEWLKQHGYRVLENVKGGYGAAIRAGVEAATGDIIVEWPPDGNSLAERMNGLWKPLDESAHGAA